jgi:hypothetical protein
MTRPNWPSSAEMFSGLPDSGRVKMSAALCVASILTVLACAAAPALAGKGYQLRGEFAAQGGALAVDESSDPSLAAFKNDIYVADGGKVERYEPVPGPSAVLKSEFTGAETPPSGSFSAGRIAVDNSSESLDPSAGDVYVLDGANEVVDKFTAGGVYTGEQLTGTCENDEEALPCAGSKLGHPISFETVGAGAVAVDAKGDVWVYARRQGESSHAAWLDEFSDTGVFMKSFEVGAPLEMTSGLAVDSNGDLYVHAVSENVGGQGEKFNAVEKLSPSGMKLSMIGEGGGYSVGTSVAVEAVSSDVFVDAFVPRTDDEREAVDEFGPFGEPASAPVEVFPADGFEGGLGGIAVNAADGLTPSTATVYASQPEKGEVAVMQFVELPEVVTGAASEQTDVSKTEASVKLSGTVNPEGIPVNACVFEYATSEEYETGHTYSHSEPCAQSPAQINTASGPENKLTVPVSVSLSGLGAGKLYHYRLSAGNTRFPEKLEVGGDATFGPPQLSGGAVSDVGAGGATVSASVEPEQSATSYYVEYARVSEESCFASGTCPKTVEREAGAGSSLVALSEVLGGLAPQTTYRFRFVARNASGVSYGPGVVFSTSAVLPPGSSVLPDGRVYESVSPSGDGGAEVYVPRIELSEEFSRAITTELPFQVAPDGGAVAFAGFPSGADASGNIGREYGNEYVARRGAVGWEAQDVQPFGVRSAVYQAFTSGLETGFVNANDPSPLVPQAPGDGYDVLYSSPVGSGVFSPLFTVKPVDRTAEEFGSPGVEDPDPFAPLQANNKPEPVAFAGAAAGHVLFAADDALLAGSGKLEKELATIAAKESANHEMGDFLYESVEGHLGLVDVLPSGAVAPQAEFGGDRSFSHVISADGSRIYWTSGGQVYVREGGVKTVRVSEGVAQFWTASGDGHYAFYTEGEKLFRFDIEGKTAGETRQEIAGVGAKVQGVVGASENGEYVYFVADGQLASGAKEGQPNLYLYHAGSTSLIATLSPEDNGNVWFQGSGDATVRSGDWMADLGDRTAEVAPDGHSVAFMSQAPIKTVNFPEGYDNEVTETYHNAATIETNVRHLAEVYVYEAEGGGLFCVSCQPGGAPPSVYDARSGGPSYVASVLPISWSNTYQMHWLSDSGGRVFFDSLEPLVGRDSNGTFDVYEWERDGEGSCGESDGCIYLISGGGGTQENASYLLGASESGGDVFIASRSHLLGREQGESMRVYDARVGGYEPPAVSRCSGTGCQGVPPAPPIFAAPASETFNGVGNFPSPTPTVVKPKSKTVRCKKGLVKKKVKKREECVRIKTSKRRAKKSAKGRK